MALTVGEILNMEEFREYRVLCGKRGLAQEVSNVTVMDTPNPQEWTRPGELVVSSGFILQCSRFSILCPQAGTNRGLCPLFKAGRLSATAER